MIQIHANMLLHLGSPLRIGQTQLKDNDSQPGVSSQDSIKDDTPNPTVTPKFFYLYKCSSMENIFLDVFEKSNCLDTTILESLTFLFF